MIRAENPGLLQHADIYGLASTSELAIDPSPQSIEAPAAVRPRSISIRMLFALCAISLLAQSVLVVLDPQAMVAFNALIALEFLFAAAGCFGMRRAKRRNPGAMDFGCMWIFSLDRRSNPRHLRRIAGNIQPTTTATMADFFFLIYGIPVLLAISLTNEEANLRVLFWLDGAQAIVATVLIYFQIYSILPSTGHSIAISTTSFMYVYNVENLTLAGAVTLRL